MRFGVLGPLAVWTDEGTTVRVPGAKVRALAALLLAHRDEAVSVDRLIDELWDAPPPDPAGAVQTAVSRLRGALDRAEPGYRVRVASGPSGYRLRVDADDVDAGRFEVLITAARAAEAPRERVRILNEALALWRGPALADHADAPFAAAPLARWEEMRLAALEDRVRARLDLGEGPELVAELGELVREHPVRERLRAAHMLALYRAGRQGEALESHRRLRESLTEELGVDPGPEITRLYEDILAQSPALTPAAPPRAATEHHPHVVATGTTAPSGRSRGSVPAPVTDVVGRDACVAEVRRNLTESRLTTLLGPGGVGKTTMALASVGVEDGRFGPVWFVELSGRDGDAGDGVADDVAAVLGIHDETPRMGSARPMTARIAESLGQEPALVVLDNCEHLIASVADLVTRLLGAAPGLRVLTTSREPLGIPGERLHRVDPLGLPTGSSPEEVAASDAATLFVRRAAASVPGFAVDGSNAEAVAAICRHLDGLPLALELAAARVRSLGVHRLADRLHDRFRVLGTGGYDRRRTLWETVDWSWRLLTGAERAVLRRLSVPTCLFTLETAEVVAADPDGEPAVTAADVAGILAGLVDRSLIAVERGGTRYRLLETIRAYAGERSVAAGEEDRTRYRYARHIAERSGRGEARDFTLDPHPAESDLRAVDVRTAIEWAADHGHADIALRIAAYHGWFWYLSGRYREGYRLLSRALAAEGTAAPADRAEALLWHAALGVTECAEQGAPESALAAVRLTERLTDPRAAARAEALLVFMAPFADPDRGEGSSVDDRLAVALRVFETTDEPWWTAFSLHLRGWRSLRRSDLRAARHDADRSLALFSRTGEPWGAARANSLLGVVAGIEGAYAEAAHRHGLALEHAERLGLWPTVVDELGRLARVHMLTGDLRTSDEYNLRALRIAAEQAFHAGRRFSVAGLGMTARRRGDLDLAEEYMNEVLATHRMDGYRPGSAFALAELGFAAELRGDADEARDLHLQGLGDARQSGDPRTVALALEGLAGAAALAGDGRSAARLVGAAERAREEAGVPMPEAERFDVDRILNAARALLGEEATERAGAEGRALSLEAAIALALAPAREPQPR
ncbi:BTAD domain-containing putative transcriptional regulator [Nocardiopsis sp. N85]|uniref:AfsR/SARP family transcriptional regulator n=1 Tax=Nocardiopsis sp. N85 TaxID=3029400 RepID=UPI00237F95D7|nr:BTAD domain-containing putative transcriptional regulator [Nocardiopsis sp. N85]MDE3720095.1 BTAD domain-containing putative transcriptional regulator [Nocardiopsis sp. N85]